MADIKAEARDGIGKGVARSLRRAGRIPAVLYGKGRDNVNLSVDVQAWNRLTFKSSLIHLRTQPQTLTIDGERSQPVLLRDLQKHPVSGLVEHLDFLRFDAKKEIQIMVPIKLLDADAAPGVKRGGMVQVVRHQLEIHCAAEDIPVSIDIPVGEMDIGDSIHISSVSLPKGVEIRSEVDFTVVALVGIKDEPTGDEEDEAEDSGEVVEGEDDAEA